MQIEEKPPGSPPFATPFEWIGGEDKIRAVVERFYDLMDLEPGYAQLRASHQWLRQALMRVAQRALQPTLQPTVPPASP
jgi:hypothetical protein